MKQQRDTTMSTTSPLELWNLSWESCAKDVDLTNARVGGKASKANPNKEDEAWWQANGPQWVSDYINFRQNNPQWKIWKTPQGVKAVELEVNPVIAGVEVKMFIDRVFDVNGTLVIVDLKTSSRTPDSDLQLGFYKVGIEQVLGVTITHGAYWMSRKQSMTETLDLSRYTLDTIEYMTRNFDVARKSGIFLPNLSSCGFCGLAEHCTFKKEK